MSRGPSPDFGPEGCCIGWSRGKLGAGRFLSKLTCETPEKDHFPGWPQPTGNPGHWQHPCGLDGLQRLPHAWEQRRACGTCSQGGEDTAAEDVVVVRGQGSHGGAGVTEGLGKGHPRAQARGTRQVITCHCTSKVLSPKVPGPSLCCVSPAGVG